LNLADQIRDFVYSNYIKPARQANKKKITIRAGDIHNQMNLVDRMPAVCGAIGTKKFENKYDVRLIKRDGSTQGANVYFTFGI